MTTVRVLVSTASLFLAALCVTASTPTASPESGQRTASPATPAAPDPAGNLARGQYLVEHVAMCIECHSPRDPAGNILPGREYMGAQIPFTPPWPINWATHAPRNAGLVGYTDAAAMRLLTEGAIGRLGSQLKAPMPRFRMTQEDAAAVIAYLRTR